MAPLTNLALPIAALTKGVVPAGMATIIVLSLAGCGPTATAPLTPNAVTEQNPLDMKYYPSDEPVKLGIQRFHEGSFGLAQQYFQNAVETTPKDATAWVGLAASYDRLGRYDLADPSYAAAVNLVGNTPSILNNQGYSYMLRGDFRRARASFNLAIRLDPGNAKAANNLALLYQSAKFVERPPDAVEPTKVRETCGNIVCAQ